MTDHNIFLAVAIAESVIAALLMIRVARGPTVADRVVAINAMSTQLMLAVFCYAAAIQEQDYVDVVLWLATFSYLATFVWARLVERELL